MSSIFYSQLPSRKIGTYQQTLLLQQCTWWCNVKGKLSAPFKGRYDSKGGTLFCITEGKVRGIPDTSCLPRGSWWWHYTPLFTSTSCFNCNMASNLANLVWLRVTAHPALWTHRRKKPHTYTHTHTHTNVFGVDISPCALSCSDPPLWQHCYYCSAARRSFSGALLALTIHT